MKYGKVSKKQNEIGLEAMIQELKAKAEACRQHDAPPGLQGISTTRASTDDTSTHEGTDYDSTERDADDEIELAKHVEDIGDDEDDSNDNDYTEHDEDDDNINLNDLDSMEVEDNEGDLDDLDSVETAGVNSIDNTKEMIRVTVDSGAAESVIPPSVLPTIPATEPPTDKCYRAANGAKLKDMGGNK